MLYYEAIGNKVYFHTDTLLSNNEVLKINLCNQDIKDLPFISKSSQFFEKTLDTMSNM